MPRRSLGVLWFVGLGIGVAWPGLPAPAQEGQGQQRPSAHAPPPWNGISAGLEAWRRGEQVRQAAWQQQLVWDDHLRYRLGVPLGREISAEGEARAWGISALPLLPPFDRDSVYAYSDFFASGYQVSANQWRIFSPWPFLPADLYGPPVVPFPARHPDAQQEVQTGPRRWESRPWYASPAPGLLSPAQAPQANSFGGTGPGLDRPVSEGEKAKHTDRESEHHGESDLHIPPKRMDSRRGPREY